ncbi:MAG: hypothetical protein U1E38_04455 [Rhodospirillales bacterium]
MDISRSRPATTPNLAEFAALKVRQRGMWCAGDYAVVGTTLQIVGEELSKPSTCAPVRRCWTWPPAMAMRAAQRAGGAM